MKLLLSKIWRWSFKSSLYLEKSKRYGEYAIYLIIYNKLWRPCWFSIFGGRWEYFTILFEIITDENVGIVIKTKSLDGLIRKIFVIKGFHLISMLIKGQLRKIPRIKNYLRSLLFKISV